MSGLHQIEQSQAFSRTVPQVKLGPGARVKLNSAGKRHMLARAKRLRKNRAGFIFWAILTGALNKRDIDEAGL